jgi:MFS family permease
VTTKVTKKKAREQMHPVVRATATISFLQGMTATALIPRVPDLISQLGLNFMQWGSLLGFIALASLLPLVFTNKLVMQYGTRNVIAIGSTIFAATIAFIPWCTSAWMFAIVAVTQTLAGSAFNIALQASAVILQKKLKKTVMGKVHAAWSIGATISAALSGALVPIMDFKLQFGITAAIITTAMVTMSRYLFDKGNDGRMSEQKHTKKISWLKTPGYVWLLTLGLFAGVWCESVMIDWSAVYGKQVLGITPTEAAFTYTCFAGAMIVGRLSIDKVTKYIHISQMSMFGSVVGFAGILGGVMLAPNLMADSPTLGFVVVCISWMLCGLGSAALVPAFFSAAGHVQGLSTAQALSRMSFVNTLIFMAGKSTFGALAQQDLKIAMLTPLLTFVVVGIVSALVVKTAKRREKEMVEAFPVTGVIPVISTNDN